MSAYDDEFFNCDWSTQKEEVLPRPPPSLNQMPILHVEGIEEYRTHLPLLRREEIATIFYSRISNVGVVDVLRLMGWDGNHYAFVELETVQHAKKGQPCVGTVRTLLLSERKTPLSPEKDPSVREQQQQQQQNEVPGAMFMTTDVLADFELCFFDRSDDSGKEGLPRFSIRAFPTWRGDVLRLMGWDGMGEQLRRATPIFQLNKTAYCPQHHELAGVA
uniref:Uncharacterized protein n=1 Tax=Globodera rostochiensis TaxID=31243 RepID=A0A914H6P1_GLORO